MNKLLFPILSIAAAVGLYFLYIGPTYAEIQALQAKEAEFDQAFIEAREVRNVLEELQSSYSSISDEDLRKLEIFLPENVDVTRVIQNTASIIEAKELPINNIGVEEAVVRDNEQPKVREHKVRFSVDSSYNTFISLIADIENSLQLANVTDLKLGTDATRESSDASSDFIVTLTMYSFK